VAVVPRDSLTARDPLERAAAAHLLGQNSDTAGLLRPLLRDPKRLVRLEAEWALSPTLADGSPERAELDAYLSLSLDQPAGRMRLGEDLANRGKLADAEREMQLAAKWDPHSAAIFDSLAYVLDARDQPREAAAQFLHAAQLNPNDAQPAFRAALDFARAERLGDAEAALRLAIQRDPNLARAWYNLGLLLAQTKRLPEAVDALKRAESLAPDSPDYPYALATVLVRMGDREGAIAAARRTLVIDPNNANAHAFLGSQLSEPKP